MYVCMVFLPVYLLTDPESMARLIRLAFPQTAELSFPAHVCSQGGVKSPPKSGEGTLGPIMTFPPNKQLKAFTEKN